MKSLRDARQEYWRRFRMICRRHRPLPTGFRFDHDDLIGTDLDLVLEGPERMPIAWVATREEQVVSAPPLTAQQRTQIELEHMKETMSSERAFRGRYRKADEARVRAKLQDLIDEAERQRESRRR